MNQRLSGLLIVTLAACLVSCGGGGGSAGGNSGGGSTTPPAPPPASAVPLVLSQSNMADVLSHAAATPESVLQLAQLGVDFARLVRARANVSLSLPCRGGGTVDLALTDSDANGVPSAGDSLRMTLRSCYSQALDDVATGQVTYAFAAPAAGAAEAYAGTLVFTSGFTIGDPAANQRAEAGGSLGVAWTDAGSTVELRVTAATADDFALVLVNGATRRTEKVKAPSLSRTFDFGAAQVVNRIAYSLESELLAGRIDVDAPTPFTGYIMTYPDTGMLRVRGDSSVRLEATPSTQNGVAGTDTQMQAITVSTGAVLASRVVPWSDLVEGFFWWDPAAGVTTPGTGYATQGRPLSADFALLYQAPRVPIDVNSEIVLQFNRPLSSAETFAFRFLPQVGVVPPDQIIAATTRVIGGRIAIKPVRQLAHATYYQVEKLSGRFIPQGGTVESNQSLSVVQTRSNLVASAAPNHLIANAGATVQLDASASRSTDGPIASYRWRQVSGTPATLTGANAAIATALLNVGAAPAETALFELSIENGFGEVETRSVAVQQVNDPAHTIQLYFRGTAGSFPLNATAIALTTANGQFTLVPNLQGLRISHTSTTGAFASVDALGTDNLPLAPGAYENAVSSRPIGQTPPILAFTANNGLCFGLGRFDVYEVAFDAGGNLTRLALDFEHGCQKPDLTTLPPTFGSVRINSTRPIRE